jgi:hypothetical protein
MTKKMSFALILAAVSVLLAAAAFALEVTVSNTVDTGVSVAFSYTDAATGRVTTSGWFKVQAGETSGFEINADEGDEIYAAAFNKDQFFDGSTRQSKPVTRWCSSRNFKWEGESGAGAEGAWSAKFYPAGHEGDKRVVRVDTDADKRLAEQNPVTDKKTAAKADSAQPRSPQGLEASAAQLKLMSVFISNFTELSLFDFDAKELASANPPAELVSFGIWHNYRNNYKSRIVPCKIKDCEWGGLTIDGKYVTESVKKYFDIDLKPVSLEDSEYRYHYDGKLYHFNGADGEMTHYADVREVSKDGDVLIMKGIFYDVESMHLDDSENPADYQTATFEATAKPYKYGGKDTWAILSMRSEW